MNKPNRNERPEVYALRQDGLDWQISRRDFLKAAGVGAAALSAGLTAGCSRKRPLDVVCSDIPAHNSIITGLIVSADGKYLLSLDSGSVIKCWDLERQSLLGSIRQSYGNYSVGYHDGASCLFLNSGKEEVTYYALPLTKFTANEAAVEMPAPFRLPGLNATKLVFDSSENIYASGSGSISCYRKDDDYQQAEVLYEPSNRSTIQNLQLFHNEKSLFVLWSWNDGYGIFDLEKKAMSYFKGSCTAYALLPDDKQALICYKKSYALVSLETHANVWEQTAPKPGGGENYSIAAAAVTPDGTTGILIVTYQQNCWLYLISLADGSKVNEYALGNLVRSENFAGPVVSPDGTILSVSVGKSILFFSLPDLQLNGCPVDIDEAKNDTKGIEISAADAVTGETYTYTLPCGTGLPAGAVCTCNCVKGRGGCSCDSHSKSSGGGSKSGPHYWHPN